MTRHSLADSLNYATNHPDFIGYATLAVALIVFVAYLKAKTDDR